MQTPKRTTPHRTSPPTASAQPPARHPLPPSHPSSSPLPPQLHLSFLPCPSSPCSLSPRILPSPLFARHLPIAHSFSLRPFPGPAECAERLNPPPLPYGKSWRVESKTEVHNADLKFADLRPPHISPSAPAHSARPPQNHHRVDFCDFHFARHWPSEMQKTR